MVLGYHLCFGAYGFWLPNDPRGSGSWHVWAEHLRRFGPATGLDDRRRSVAGREHDWRLRLAAKRSLNHPAVKFTGIQARSIGTGFETLVKRDGFIVWACCILPQHAHMVIARHEKTIEKIAERLKGAATHRLIAEELHPFGHLRTAIGLPPKCWQRGQWAVYLDSHVAIRREIKYVEENPEKEGKPRQRWPFVVPYEG
jgi:REP element-mobilizing transposase RayT